MEATQVYGRLCDVYGNNTDNVEAKAVLDDCGIRLEIDGYGGGLAVAVLEKVKNDVRLCVWSDPSVDEPTHIINLKADIEA